MVSNDFWQYISKASKPIWLYGMGDGADKIINALKLYNVKPYGVFASDDFVRGQNFRGYTVKKYSDAVDECGDIIVLVCFGTSIESVIDNIKKIMSEQETYAPDVPVYGSGLFNLEFCRQNKDKIKTVYNLLADEQSKKVFANTINYKLTGKLSYLFECESDINESFDILNLHNESYLDLGAYRGDTVDEFLNYCKDCQHIYAVEPDRKSFEKLKQNVSHLNNISLYNVCIADKKGSIPFSMKSGRHSSMGGEKLFNCESVDSLLNSNKATYIKIDVEGAEALAVDGAKKTILNFKPKMNIACYHRNEDIFDLPLRVMKIRSDYKIYLRHFKSVPSWDTQFYFI